MRTGDMKIDWARSRMPVLGRLVEDGTSLAALKGRRVAMCIHLEAKTAVLALALREAGAAVEVASSNPLSTQDDVAEALARRDVGVHALRGVDAAGYRRFLEEVLSASPELVLDDGGDLVALAVETGTGGILGATEETTTGLHRFRALERAGRLPCPVVAVNDSPMKHLFDNRYGTGQSVLDGIIRATNLSLAGKRLVTVGFGDCGRGVALRAKGMGARVGVVEVDPVRANEAYFEGYRVMDMDRAAAWGDIFVTVTGNIAVIRGRHFDRMRDGAILSNAGHFDVEIARGDLDARTGDTEEVRPGVAAHRLRDGRTLFVLAEGRLVNLAAADGHPVEIMDLSFALQALSLSWLAEKHPEDRRVLPVPAAIDDRVARMSLEARDLGLETMTEAQRAYLDLGGEG